MEKREITCNEKAAECVCVLPPDHQSAHECECGGQWTGAFDSDSFKIVRWPQIDLATGKRINDDLLLALSRALNSRNN